MGGGDLNLPNFSQEDKNKMIKKVIYDTAAGFTSKNWTLLQGTQGIETDTKKVKEGDGTTAWTSLGYSAGGQAGPTLITTPVSTVSIAEFGDSRDNTTVLTLTNFVVGALAGAGAALGIGNIVAVYPAGNHLELLDYASLNLKCAGTAVAAKLGLGSVIASGAVSVLSGTATFQDRLTAMTVTTDPAGGTAVESLVAPTAGIGLGISLNVTGSIKNIFLNAAGTWNANNTGNLTASGTITLKWTKMGA
jgi:hypothetical protein